MINKLAPIVLDIETTGTDLVKCGIWQIGAIDLNTMEEFFDEARIDDENEIIDLPAPAKPVLESIGKTEKELRDKNKQPQKELLKKFIKWIDKRKVRNFLCHNPWFDMGFINVKIDKYEIKRNFHHRAFDLHSIAQTKFHEINGKFLFKEEDLNEICSGLSLPKVLEFCGLKDERKAHNALEDCKLTGECFSRLICGKNLFPEYSKFKIPKELLK
jgi:DNA polymerase III epsilon subunit-like protein